MLRIRCCCCCSTAASHSVMFNVTHDWERSLQASRVMCSPNESRAELRWWILRYQRRDDQTEWRCATVFRTNGTICCDTSRCGWGLSECLSGGGGVGNELIIRQRKATNWTTAGDLHDVELRRGISIFSLFLWRDGEERQIESVTKVMTRG